MSYRNCVNLFKPIRLAHSPSIDYILMVQVLGSYVPRGACGVYGKERRHVKGLADVAARFQHMTTTTNTTNANKTERSTTNATSMNVKKSQTSRKELQQQPHKERRSGRSRRKRSRRSRKRSRRLRVAVAAPDGGASLAVQVAPFDGAAVVVLGHGGGMAHALFMRSTRSMRSGNKPPSPLSSSYSSSSSSSSSSSLSASSSVGTVIEVTSAAKHAEENGAARGLQTIAAARGLHWRRLVCRGEGGGGRGGGGASGEEGGVGGVGVGVGGAIGGASARVFTERDMELELEEAEIDKEEAARESGESYYDVGDVSDTSTPCGRLLHAEIVRALARAGKLFFGNAEVEGDG